MCVRKRERKRVGECERDWEREKKGEKNIYEIEKGGGGVDKRM